MERKTDVERQGQPRTRLADCGFSPLLIAELEYMSRRGMHVRRARETTGVRSPTLGRNAENPLASLLLLIFLHQDARLDASAPFDHTPSPPSLLSPRYDSEHAFQPPKSKLQGKDRLNNDWRQIGDDEFRLRAQDCNPTASTERSSIDFEAIMHGNETGPKTERAGDFDLLRRWHVHWHRAIKTYKLVPDTRAGCDFLMSRAVG
ncbi:hypothetical protein DB88DRAFT_471443 [Papiliotrema laurentii]|uniref:Uncharacterized protein n=1 Tax=Papiliotrema laurentii TaxID=5418 RepID=A0AAD9FSH8_PAPLA|nr:hypothetical protein DB88DRAFT_471443 [Papiliotrema laurentii]